jgi:hypothetical protein
MGDLIDERFNWKWNRAAAPAFYTNSYQQDYPLVGLSNVGWLEECDLVDINAINLPKHIYHATVRRALSRSSLPTTRPDEIAWAYNNELSYGTWPGAGVTYHPLVTTQPIVQNPLMNFVDANGNLLVLTGFGVTGLAAPAAIAAAVEGAIVNDGSCKWTVAAMGSQGFRLLGIPGASGPTLQVIPYYQMKPLVITTVGQLINPIPDDQARHFRRGYEAYCLSASPNPGDRGRFNEAHMNWLNSMIQIRKAADKEQDSYGLVPATNVVEPRYGWGPHTAGSGAN